MGSTPLASHVSIGGISMTLDMLSPTPPYPDSPQWDPTTLDQTPDLVHAVPLPPTTTAHSAYSTNSATAPSAPSDAHPLSASASPSTNTDAGWSRTQVPATGRRQRWYKSIYPLVDAYSSANGLRWRARGWSEGARVNIGLFQDELEAARAAQQWLAENVSKVALTLSRMTNL